MTMKKIDIKTLKESAVSLFDDSRCLITAGNEDSYNTMTASWGGLGVLWNKNVAFTFIRPSRYTYEFTQKEDTFSLCFFPEEYRKALTLCGTKSGRDCDKIKEAGLTPAFVDDVPCFEEASMIVICKKIYAQKMSADCALTDEIKKHYAEDEPYHTVYVGEILKVYVKE